MLEAMSTRLLHLGPDFNLAQTIPVDLLVLQRLLVPGTVPVAYQAQALLRPVQGVVIGDRAEETNTLERHREVMSSPIAKRRRRRAPRLIPSRVLH